MTIIGIIVIIFGLICWVGQSLAFLVPKIAVKLGVSEPEEDMDPTFFIIDTQAIALNDMLLTWTLPLSGFLMIMNNPTWPYLALIGGGIYLYFAGYISLGRIFLKNKNKKTGSPSSEKLAYVFSIIWALSALAMIWLGCIELAI